MGWFGKDRAFTSSDPPGEAYSLNGAVKYFEPVMVRKLDGVIQEWNRAAEKAYGYTRLDAVGRVSHEILGTIFPIPLERINERLLRDGEWEGELMHSLNDGRRVKVHSRWQLLEEVRSEDSPPVIEFNRRFEVIKPESAHFGGILHGFRRTTLQRVALFLLLAALGVGVVAVEFSSPVPVISDYRD